MKWLDNYGKVENPNDTKLSFPKGFVGDGYSNKGRNFSPAWGGPYQKGGKIKKLKDEREEAITKKDNIQKLIPSSKIRPLSAQEKKERQIQQTIERQGEITQSTPQSTLSKVKEVALNPLTAFGYVARNQSLPENFSRGERNVMDNVIDFVNPAFYAESANSLVQNQGQVFSDLYEGNFQDAGINQLMAGVDALSFLPIAKPAGRVLRNQLPKIKNIPSTISSKLKKPVIKETDVFSNIISPKNILVDEQYMGNKNVLDALDEVKSTTLPSKTRLNDLRDAIDDGETWKYSEINPIEEIERFKKSAKTEADIAYINALEKRYESLRWQDPSRNRANPVFVTGQSLDDFINPVLKNAEGNQFYAIQPFRGVEPKGKFLQYISDEADYIHDTKFLLPGNRFDHLGMRKAMSEDVSQYFNERFKNFNPDLKDIPLNRNGGIIKDNLGQWAHPGEITEINSNDITMQGVPYPVLGISDEGDTKLMEPGKDYKFKGKKVTEFPLAKNGKALTRLDQLTNFTNYNTPQPGSGWLDKY